MRVCLAAAEILQCCTVHVPVVLAQNGIMRHCMINTLLSTTKLHQVRDQAWWPKWSLRYWASPVWLLGLPWLCAHLLGCQVLLVQPCTAVMPSNFGGFVVLCMEYMKMVCFDKYIAAFCNPIQTHDGAASYLLTDAWSWTNDSISLSGTILSVCMRYIMHSIAVSISDLVFSPIVAIYSWNLRQNLCWMGVWPMVA